MRELCDSLSGEEFELTVILSDSLRVRRRATVIGKGPDSAWMPLESSFSFVQVYTIW